MIIKPLLGSIPALDPNLLPQNNAQIARDCYLKNGVLRPAKGLQSLGITLQPSTKSVFHYNRKANGGNGFWLEFDKDVDAAVSPIVNDPYLRVYFTGDGIPQFTAVDVATGGAPYPFVTYDLGLPAPAAPTASGPATQSGSSIEVDTAYVMTYVDKYGAEGPPSQASNVVTRWDGEVVSLTNLEVPNGNFVVNTKRIYRVELQGIYQLVAEIPAGSSSFVDAVNSANLSVALPSESWVAPNINMIGLTGLPNGIMMGWWDNNLAFSEPYRPHAWPIEYRHALDDEIVGAALSDVGIIVATKSQPYLLVGATPDSMLEQKLDANHACVSKRSVVDLGSQVVYASKEGLVSAGGVFTAGQITAEQWEDLVPESIHAYRWRDRYLAFYDTGTTKGSFTFHPEEGFIFYSVHADYGHYDPHSGDVYLITGNSLQKWHGGSDLPYTWRSRVSDNMLGRVPSAAKVDADNYPVIFRFFADDALIKEHVVSSRRAFRLPNRSHFDKWEAEVTGTNTIKSIQVAMSMSEIK